MTGWIQGRWAALLDAGAAAIFGGACAFAAHAFAESVAVAVAAGGAAAALSFAALQRIASPAQFALTRFEATGWEMDELLLTLDDRLLEPTAADELLLEDLLERPDADSRVVQLFDCRMPTAGELQARIERHLRSGSPAPVVPDASAELQEALASLRRSLH